MSISEISHILEGLLLLCNDYTIKEDATELPSIDENIIHIGKNCEHWKKVYQLSHEYLHAAFNEHCKGTNTIEYRWIEEILCEAFSIYCLKRFCRESYNEWGDYLHPYKYCISGVCKTHEVYSSEGISSITELNDHLVGKKSYETRQFIHPVVLLLVNVIDFDYGNLLASLNYSRVSEKSELIQLIDEFVEIKRLKR